MIIVLLLVLACSLVVNAVLALAFYTLARDHDALSRELTALNRAYFKQIMERHP